MRPYARTAACENTERAKAAKIRLHVRTAACENAESKNCENATVCKNGGGRGGVQESGESKSYENATVCENSGVREC